MLYARNVFVAGMTGKGYPSAFDASGKPLVDLLPKLCLSIRAKLTGQAGRNYFIDREIEIAFIGDPLAVLYRFGKRRKQGSHLRLAFQVKLIASKRHCTLGAVGRVCGNTHKHVLRFRVPLAKVMHVVCRYKRDVKPLCKSSKLCEKLHLLGQAVILYLNIKIVAEYPLHFDRMLFCGGNVSGKKLKRYLSRKAAAESDKPA